MIEWSPPPGHPVPVPGEVHLWRVDQSAAGGDPEEALALLSAEERARRDRYRFERHRRRFALRRAALRRILAAYSGADPAAVAFRVSAHGKPELAEPGDPPLRFNLSHSEELALVAVTADADLGVDIEVVRPLDAPEALARTVFSPAELGELLDLPAADRLAGFFNGWTRKEAWLKARGEGLIGDLEGFDVTLAPGREPRLLRVAGDPDEAARWRLVAFAPAPGAVAAVALRAASCRLAFWAP